MTPSPTNKYTSVQPIGRGLHGSRAVKRVKAYILIILALASTVISIWMLNHSYYIFA